MNERCIVKAGWAGLSFFFLAGFLGPAGSCADEKTSTAAAPSPIPVESLVTPSIASPLAYGRALLAKEGFPEKFIRMAARQYDEEERDRVIQLNIYGFLARADYSVHYTSQAVRKCRKFLKSNWTALKTAEKLYGVPKEVITALLWVETKHGKQTGSFRVPLVFFYLAQADHPEVLRRSIEGLKERLPASESFENARQQVVQRSKLKAAWALGELKSLERLYRKQARMVGGLYGSHSGAFGVPQFIPSSYLEWGQARDKARLPNLFNFGDSILSVGYYLKANGWNNADPNSQREAIYHYNRSQGYVNVILQLAEGLTPPSGNAG